MKLCFGTFVNVLLLCGAPGVEKKKLLNTILKSVDSECDLSSSAVTGLIKCTSNLPGNRANGLGDIMNCAENAEPKKVADYFAAKVVTQFLDNNKRKLAMLALLELIDRDNSIGGDYVVEKVSLTTKKNPAYAEQICAVPLPRGRFSVCRAGR